MGSIAFLKVEVSAASSEDVMDCQKTNDCLFGTADQAERKEIDVSEARKKVTEKKILFKGCFFCCLTAHQHYLGY